MHLENMCKCHENPFLIKLQGSEPEPEKVWGFTTQRFCRSASACLLIHSGWRFPIFRSWDEDPKPPTSNVGGQFCQDGIQEVSQSQRVYLCLSYSSLAIKLDFGYTMAYPISEKTDYSNTYMCMYCMCIYIYYTFASVYIIVYVYIYIYPTISHYISPSHDISRLENT